jgi:hypothetical protein
MAYSFNQDALIEIQMVGTLHGQTIRNVFHYLYQDSDPVTDGAAEMMLLAQTFRDDIWSQLQNLIAAEYVLDYITCQVTNPTRFRLVELAVGEAGAATADALPSTTAVVISLYAEFSGRMYQGRKYFAGLSKVNESNSKLLSTEVGNWQSFADILVEDLVTNESGNSYELTVETPESYTGNGQAVVIEAVVRDVLRVQRRREVGVGE